MIVFTIIFRAADPSTTKLSLMVHYQYHTPVCPVKRPLCCVQGQGHGGGSELHFVFVSPVFTVLLTSLQPN